jgi:hypothetical protein
MPFKLNWQKVNEFENEKNLDLFLLANVQTSTGKSNTVNCSMCADNGHNMIYKHPNLYNTLYIFFRIGRYYLSIN